MAVKRRFKTRKIASSASPEDLAELRSGKGSARDRAEAGRSRHRKRRRKRG